LLYATALVVVIGCFANLLSLCMVFYVLRAHSKLANPLYTVVLLIFQSVSFIIPLDIFELYINI
jgi:hypothetical protein